ncbi:tRNA lysidine(34) synthetase TilS [Psychrobacter sp. B38]|uniref:tRNA lysidine(34) synthetase TilS n=1 Tax=Psychrobacter sp. B38 TaxID=3143538 RepID=UPI00320C1E0C
MTSSAILTHPIRPTADLPTDETLADALLSSLSAYGKQLHGRRVWLACSGGRDSLALAAMCVQLYHQGRLPFLPQLLHVDHGLQVDSHHWATHIALWAQRQQIPCHILHAQVDGHDEQAARQARYGVMRKHMNQDDVLLLAHHADDQAETVLMRLMQGAGVNGLSGMQPWRVQKQAAHRVVLWRPWLTIQRANISAYAKQLKLPYIDDPTNEAGDNVRSGLRRDIMPALAKFNPNVVSNMARSAQLLSDAEATVRAQAAQDMQQVAVQCLQLPPAQRVLNIDALVALPEYRQRQLLHHWLVQDEPLPPAKQLIDDVLRLSQRSDHDHQTALFWQGRQRAYTICRYRQQLYRLSAAWLAWFKAPLIDQTQLLLAPTALASTINVTKANDNKANDNKANDAEVVPMPLRMSKDFIWQLHIKPQMLASLLTIDKDEPRQTFLKVTPLDRKQRLKTSLSTRPQAGKKLFQTLGIPFWLRGSLVVVSIDSGDAANSENAENESVSTPILLLSPFNHWIVESHLSPNIKRLDSDRDDALKSSVQTVE